MGPQPYERKLTAILSADVAGYSRLMGEDDEATVSTLTGHRRMMVSLIEQHRGRVVDSPGDNLLAEFSSVLNAVNCAAEIQREFAERNAELPEDRRMEFRIGVNLGEVIEEGDRIYGDGVNIAARLESLAEPGGICISGFAYNQVKNRLKLEYEYLGEQSVKNIKEPVPVYRVLSFPGAAAHRVVEAKRAALKEKSSLSFQDKPSIAVLPFVNMSDDPKQEYFSDGMTEELISALAKVENLKIISRTSAFYFKGEHVDLRTIGEKLKVNHVLEGSVRKAGNKLRITAQLINVADDTHLWSESYNRELTDVFDIQEEISQAIVKNLKVKLLGKKTEPLVKDYTKNTEAYELFLKAKYYENKGLSGYDKAIEYYGKTIEVDPNYAPAYINLAKIHFHVVSFNSLPLKEVIQKINALLQNAIEIDDKYGPTYAGLGVLKMFEYDWKGAELNFKRALELNPGFGEPHETYAAYLMAIGNLNEAILEVKRALEFDPLSSWYRFRLGIILCYSSQFDQAIEIGQETLELDPNNAQISWALALAYGGKRMYDKAISTVQRFEDVPNIAAYLGYLYGKAGNREEAQKIIDDFLLRSKKGYFSPYLIAQVYSGLGDKGKVFEWLNRAYDMKDHLQWTIKSHYCFADLHSDPRWPEQLKKRGLAD